MTTRNSSLALKWSRDAADGTLSAGADAADAFVRMFGVNLTYGGPGGIAAVDDLTLSVRKGEFAAVVGPSGCGKSTLMKLATGLVIPQAGSIEVDGAPVTGPLNIVGMAFQNPSLLPWRQVLGNIMLPLEIVSPHRQRLKRDRAEYVAKAEAILNLVGLEGFGSKFPWQLSGGMQQRCNLCRALIHEPGLLMLDEPFGALDAFTREELWGVIRDLHQAKRFTVILVTHDLREAVYLADRVFVMSSRPGRVLVERQIPFERPRPIDLTFTGEFNDIVHELRGTIAEARADKVAMV
jgi:NitT/TauT family transport system ATP-binding protein